MKKIILVLTNRSTTPPTPPTTTTQLPQNVPACYSDSNLGMKYDRSSQIKQTYGCTEFVYLSVIPGRFGLRTP